MMMITMNIKNRIAREQRTASISLNTYTLTYSRFTICDMFRDRFPRSWLIYKKDKGALNLNLNNDNDDDDDDDDDDDNT